MRWSTGICLGAMVATGSLAHAAGTPKSVLVTVETATGQDGGAILLVEEHNALRVTVQLQDLDPGMHGVHIHQNASCDAPTFVSAGDRFSPSFHGHQAGIVNVDLKVGDNGKVRQSFTVQGLTLAPNAPNSVFANGGTSIVVQRGPNRQNAPSAGAGGSEACGIISIKHASSTILHLRPENEQVPASND